MTTQREATRNVSYAPLFEANACEFASSQQHLLDRNHASPPEARRLKANGFSARALNRVPIWGRPRRRSRARRVAPLHRITSERRGWRERGQPHTPGATSATTPEPSITSPESMLPVSARFRRLPRRHRPEYSPRVVALRPRRPKARRISWAAPQTQLRHPRSCSMRRQ